MQKYGSSNHFSGHHAYHRPQEQEKEKKKSDYLAWEVRLGENVR